VTRAQRAKSKTQKIKAPKKEARQRAVLKFVFLVFEICSASRGRLTPAFTGRLADWLFHAFSARWRFVMRYRSATVADSHGLPLNLERNKRTTDPRRLHELAGFAQPFCLSVSCQASPAAQRSSASLSRFTEVSYLTVCPLPGADKNRP